MKKWFIHCETDIMGTDSYELIEAETEKEAEYDAEVMAYENFQSYDCWDDEMEDEGFIEGEHWNYTIEEYNPEKHNDYLYDSELKEEFPKEPKGDSQ